MILIHKWHWGSPVDGYTKGLQTNRYSTERKKEHTGFRELAKHKR